MPFPMKMSCQASPFFLPVISPGLLEWDTQAPMGQLTNLLLFLITNHIRISYTHIRFPQFARTFSVLDIFKLIKIKNHSRLLDEFALLKVPFGAKAILLKISTYIDTNASFLPIYLQNTNYLFSGSSST